MNNTNTKTERRAAHEADHKAERTIINFARTTKTVANPFNVETNDESWTLEFPTQYKITLGHHKAVSFRGVKGHPEMMRISSSNYCCEDEANGVYSTADARRFYVELKAAGFELK